MQSVAAWLPPTYVIHGMRAAALNGAGLPELLPDLLPLAGFWRSCGWRLGYLAFVWMERRARRTGLAGAVLMESHDAPEPVATQLALASARHSGPSPRRTGAPSGATRSTRSRRCFQPLIWLTPVYFMGQVFSINGQAQGFAGYSGTTDYVSFILLGTALQFIIAVFWGMGYSLKQDMDCGRAGEQLADAHAAPAAAGGHDAHQPGHHRRHLGHRADRRGAVVRLPSLGQCAGGRA